MKKYSLLIEVEIKNGPVYAELNFECHNFQFVDKKHFIVDGIPFSFTTPKVGEELREATVYGIFNE